MTQILTMTFCKLGSLQLENREHWIQRITFATETNAMHMQSWLGGHTHSVTDGRQATRYLQRQQR